MNRALSMLGLCARAGKLVSGEKVCLQLIRGGGAFAVLIDASAAKNAVKSITDACAHHQVTLSKICPRSLGLSVTWKSAIMWLDASTTVWTL